MSELLPCPFCGGEDVEIDHASTYDVHHPDVYEVHCPDCGGRSGEGWTEDEAIAAWNTRAERTCHETMIDKFFHGCDSCGYMWEVFYSFGKKQRPNYCPYCGAKVVEI